MELLNLAKDSLKIMVEFLNNFDKNLLEASINKENLIDAKKEWQNFREEKCLEKKTCIFYFFLLLNHFISILILFYYFF